MRAFLFMSYIKLHIDPKLLKSSEWGSFTPSEPGTRYPVLFEIEDGSAKVFLSPSYTMWIPAGTRTLWEIGTEEIPVAPNPQFSESFVLKLAAIAQDPSLSLHLLERPNK